MEKSPTKSALLPNKPFTTVNASHSFIMKHTIVKQQVMHFYNQEHSKNKNKFLKINISYSYVHKKTNDSCYRCQWQY